MKTGREFRVWVLGNGARWDGKGDFLFCFEGGLIWNGEVRCALVFT